MSAAAMPAKAGNVCEQLNLPFSNPAFLHEKMMPQVATGPRKRKNKSRPGPKPQLQNKPRMSRTLADPQMCKQEIKVYLYAAEFFLKFFFLLW